MRWHSLDLSDLVESLQTDQHRGLNKDQVAERFHQFGPNALVTIGKQAWYRVLARQFADALVIILIAAALVSLLLGDLGDAITILVIVVFNGRCCNRSAPLFATVNGWSSMPRIWCLVMSWYFTLETTCQPTCA
jgi:hypothetical protein